MTPVPDPLERTIRSELADPTASAVVDSERRAMTPAFGVLGLDADGRLVTYGEDGTLFHRPLVDGEPADWKHSDTYTSTIRPRPHSCEGAILALDTSDWTWIHPRLRWLTEREDREVSA